MTVEHRFECALCGHRIHATGAESATARQAARQQAAEHLADAHADRLAATPRWPDDPSPDDLLAGEAAYGAVRGLLVPTDDLLTCSDCGYYFGPDGDRDPDREPVGEQGLVCRACYDRRVGQRDDSIAEAIEQFVR